jgi:uncharacterized repeat protein (TIGR03806 family)
MGMMDFPRMIRALAASVAVRGAIAALVLGPFALGCTPGQGQNGGTGGKDGGTVEPPRDAGGVDQPTAGTGGLQSTGGAGGVTATGGTAATGGNSGMGGVTATGGTPANVSPPFAPTPPVPLMARWSGTIVAEYSENYTFRVTATAAVRALVKGEQILRDWTRTGSRVATGSVWLATGASYDLVVEADASVADPGLVVEWESPSKQRGPVPKSTVSDKGLTTIPAVAPFFGGKLPLSTPSSSAVKAQAVSGNLGMMGGNTVWSLSTTPGSPYIYAVGRFGQIRYFDPKLGNDTGKLFLDLTQGLFTGNDSGVINMAFHPQYGQAASANRNYVYVIYTPAVGAAPNSALRLSRFTVTEGQNTVNKSTELIMIQEPLPDTFHRGGGMTFGKDGFLYVSLGEYGNPNNGQDFANHLSAGVIRIDVDQDTTKSHAIVKRSMATNQNYFIPNDNPWVGMTNVLEEYWTKGERNPHKLTMDSVSGRMFIGNVGGNNSNSNEEVNEVIKGGNYGWPFREGNKDLGAWTFGSTSRSYQVPARPATIMGTLQDPNLIIQRPTTCNGVDVQCPNTGETTNGKCVVGGYVYHGNTLPKLANRYIIGDCNLGVIWATADDRGHGPMEYLFTAPFPGVVTFAQDKDGELYFAGSNNQVFRLVPGGTPVGEPPALISQTGVFTSARDMTPAPGVIPYDVSTPLWSDGAKKRRWMIPPTNTQQKIDVAADGSWTFPVGTVFVKHFELAQANGTNRRLETRFLVHGNDAFYYGVTYRWRADNSDADLQDGNAFNENVGTQTWHYPSRSECTQCHNSAANFVLGLKSAQFNRALYYPATGLTANMVSTLQGLGLFRSTLMPASLPQMPSVHDGTQFAQTRARAYLDANCAQCHRPSGTARGDWDGRFSTPLNMQKLIGVAPLETLGIQNAKLLAPQGLDTSILYKRLSALDGNAMPPLARSVLDADAISVFKAWIAGMNAQPKAGAPVATRNVGLSTRASTPLTLVLAGTDPDGDALDYRISQMPVHGTLEGFGKDLVYKPHPDFVGVDAFTFVVSDGTNASEPATVQIAVQ